MSTLAGAMLLAGAACSSSSPSPASGTGGTTGDGGGGTLVNTFTGVPLTPTSSGFVMDATSGVIGPWYGYADSAGPAASATGGTDFADSSCMKGGFTMAQCSTVSPAPGATFPPDPTTGAMCATGVGAQVIAGASGALDYSDIWGAGIALDFNNPGGDAGAKGSFDLSKYTGIGFDFYGATIPASKMRVNFPFTGENNGTDSPYYQGGTKDFSTLDATATTPAKAQHVTIHWSDIGGPKYLTEQTPPTPPPPFDDTKVQSIQFQVFTNQSTTTPFSFCVANLTLLTN
ncbi:MAG TPA: hypothetical protein VHG72_11385 [Polyangia bacterium]|nr:hypothetical protein [Polyangia bacterium]